MSRLISAAQVRDDELDRDPQVREIWDRTALARAVAIAVVGYRAKRQLSQRGLAQVLGWKPAQVARLELGEHTPTIETLIHLSQRIGLRFVMSIDPAGVRRRGVKPRKGDVVQEGIADGSYLRVAVGA